jgi:hypothetical protein
MNPCQTEASKKSKSDNFKKKYANCSTFKSRQAPSPSQCPVSYQPETGLDLGNLAFTINLARPAFGSHQNFATSMLQLFWALFGALSNLIMHIIII